MLSVRDVNRIPTNFLVYRYQTDTNLVFGRYFKASAFGILLVLCVHTNVKDVENLVLSRYFPHIPKSVRFRYFHMIIVGIWFGIGVPTFRHPRIYWRPLAGHRPSDH